MRHWIVVTSWLFQTFIFFLCRVVYLCVCMCISFCLFFIIQNRTRNRQKVKQVDTKKKPLLLHLSRRILLYSFVCVSMNVFFFFLSLIISRLNLLMRYIVVHVPHTEGFSHSVINSSFQCAAFFFFLLFIFINFVL